MSNQKPILPTPKPSVRKKIAHEEKAKTQLKERQAKLRANIRTARKLAAKSTAELDTILAQRGVVDNKIGVVTEDIISKLPIELRDTVKDEDIIFRPNPGPQTQFLAANEKEVFYGGARGGGKASWVEAKVATPFGFRRMGDIKTGDRICAVDGGISRVLAVHPQGEVDLYKVTTDDGGETVVTSDHLWLVSLVGSAGNRKMTTATLIKKLDSGRRIMLPVAEPVCWVKNSKYNLRKLDPYLLGVLIGDGCLRNTIRITCADTEIPQILQNRLLDGKIASLPSGEYEYSITNAPCTKAELIRLGLWNKLSYDKSVPNAYLYAPVSERMEMLQGLMDTDGTVDTEGRLSFCSVSKQLAKDVQFLVRSLGGKATLFEKKTSSDFGIAYLVYISINIPVFKLERKLKRQRLDKHVWRAIRSIEYFGKGHAQCITVDHESSLYITDDFIVTHNSYAMLADPLRYCDNKNHRALILRRTMPELRDMIAKSQQLYPRAIPGAKWREQEKEWRFPSGARIEFGYCETDVDAYRYLGQSYSWIGVDELPLFPTPDLWNFLRSSLRSPDPTLPTFMRACVDEGDVLTASGWKDIRDVKVGELVASITRQGEFVYRPVYASFVYGVDEPLVKVNKKNLYMSMTKDHRIVYRKEGAASFDICRWNEHQKKSVNIARTAVQYQGAGYTPSVRCGKLLDYTQPIGKADQKHFPREFLDKASTDQLKLAFDAYALGDGHWQSPSSVSLYTTSKQLVDDLQEICLKLGYKSQFSVRHCENPNWNSQYTVYVSINGPTTKVDKAKDGRSDVTEEHYTGNVYCLGVVDTENFVIRQRGCVWVSGNTGNPGCIGSAWVREMFIDPAPPNTRFTLDIEVPTPTGVINSSISRRFVPATVFDNPYMTYDASYITMLASLPEIQRRNFLYGDWDAFDNAAFSDFKKEVHVIDPFEIPHGWQRFRAADWGYTSPACCLWFAVDYDNNLYVYRELYANKLTADRFAQRVLELEEGESVRYGVLDASAWAKRGEVGPSIAETMIANGCRWRPSDRSPNSRKSGKLELHRRLSLDEEGRPSLFLFSNCRNLIRTLPKLPLDTNNPEDVDTTAEDHAYDALRYGVTSRPKSIETPWDMTNPTRRAGHAIADQVFGY